MIDVEKVYIFTDSRTSAGSATNRKRTINAPISFVHSCIHLVHHFVFIFDFIGYTIGSSGAFGISWEGHVWPLMFCVFIKRLNHKSCFPFFLWPWLIFFWPKWVHGQMPLLNTHPWLVSIYLFVRSFPRSSFHPPFLLSSVPPFHSLSFFQF